MAGDGGGKEIFPLHNILFFLDLEMCNFTIL